MTGRAGLRAAATLSVRRGATRQRIHWSHAWPVVVRPTGDDRVHLVHGAGGPLGGDTLSLAVDVAAGAALAVRSAGATLVQPGADGVPARWDTTVEVGAGGRLDWAPEPTVVTDGAAFETWLRVDLAAGAEAVLREVVVLGRHGLRGGRYRGELVVRLAGEALFVHTAVLDGGDPGLRGPGGTAGARAVGTLVLAGGAPGGTGWVGEPGGPGCEGVPGGPGWAGERAGVRWAWTALDGPGRVLFAVGEPGAVTALLDESHRP